MTNVPVVAVDSAPTEKDREVEQIALESVNQLVRSHVCTSQPAPLLP